MADGCGCELKLTRVNVYIQKKYYIYTYVFHGSSPYIWTVVDLEEGGEDGGTYDVFLSFWCALLMSS